MTDSLKQKTISALIWSFIERVGALSIQAIILIFLARLLQPRDFGLIGMMMFFIAIANTFLDSGFGAALIQKKGADQTDYSTIFYFNLLVSIFLFVAMFFSAPFIAQFYNEPKLIPLTRLLSFNLIINGLGLIQNILLIKKIDFRTQTNVSLIAIFIAGIIGITLAYRGFGVWSLAIQAVSMNLIRTMCLWFYGKWYPSLVFSFIALKNLFGYGSKLLASGLLETFFQNIYLLVIGKVFSAKDLGFYTQAKKIQEMPVANLSAIVGKVIFPVFSSIQDETARLKSGYKKSLKIMVFVSFPIMLGLIVIAEPVIKIFLTEKWLPSVPYIQLLALSGMLYNLQTTNLNILKVKGRSDLVLRLEVIKKMIIVIAIVIGIQWGIQGLIIGMVVTSYINYFINSYYSGLLINYSVKEQITDISPYLAISATMAIGTFLFGLLFKDHELLQLIGQLLVAAAIYLSLCKILKLEALLETMKIWNEHVIGGGKKKFNY
jgi:O-antigen/teichoic acid export membrane protein